MTLTTLSIVFLLNLSFFLSFVGGWTQHYTARYIHLDRSTQWLNRLEHYVWLLPRVRLE